MITWTLAESTAEVSIQTALKNAGFTDARDDTATSSDLLYMRDFFDRRSLQSGHTYLVYSVNPESANVCADNEKIARDVTFTATLETTKRPQNGETISLRESIEENLAQQGFRVRFLQSGFDDETKLYAFQYAVSKEIA
jgi:hypothetical protein